MADQLNEEAPLTSTLRGIRLSVSERLGAGHATVALNFCSRPDKAEKTVHAVETPRGIPTLEVDVIAWLASDAAPWISGWFLLANRVRV